MDSCQGGCDGVTTDGILKPALSTGNLHSAWANMHGSKVIEHQMDRRAEIAADMLSGAPCRLENVLFVPSKRMIMQVFPA